MATPKVQQLLPSTTTPAWFADAACRGADVDLFFQERQGVGVGGHGYREAREYCRVCPVQKQCLDYALEERLQIGFWGNTTPRERRRMWGWR